MTLRKTAAMALIVAAVYALPFAFAHGRIDVFYPDETYYAARVMDAYRGRDLRNPYLAGHEHSPKYLPELIERVLALTARVLHVPPLAVLAASRVVLAVALTIALTYFGIALGLSPGIATLAGACPALFPPILTLFQTPGMGEHGFLRLFRIVSPAAHMLLLVIALWCVYVAWKEGRWWQWIAAGIALGALAYVPIYYWAFAMLGTLILAIRRRALFWSLLVAAVVSLPHFIHATQVMWSPEVIETLARLRLMIPGRLPEPDVPRRLIENLIVIAALLLIRNRFLLAFLIAGEVLLVQNAITNRQIQAFHFMHCLFVVWPLAAALVWQHFCGERRRFLNGAFAALLVVSAVLVQWIAFANWEERMWERPQLYALNRVMPETLAWLNAKTPPGSVVLAPPDVMASLPLYTHNKIYWAQYAGQYVVSDHEVAMREEDVTTGRLRFHVDSLVTTSGTASAVGIWTPDGGPATLFQSLTRVRRQMNVPVGKARRPHR